MLVTILDGQDVPRTVVWQGQDPITDRSGTLGAPATGVNRALQQIMAANAGRAGWFFQNTSASAMLLCELDAASTVASSFVINSGEAFPPCGYPIPVGAVFVCGSLQSAAGDAFAAREW